MTSSIQSRLGTAPEEGCKAPVKTVAETPITLSGEQTINTVALVAGDRVLVSGQADTAENGIYNVQTTAWTYAKDWNKPNDVIAGMIVPSSETAQLFQVASFTSPFSAGVTPITFQLVGDLTTAISAAVDAAVAEAVGALEGGFVVQKVETQTGFTSGQTIVTLTTMDYVAGVNNLVVVRNGLTLTSGTDYTEDSTTQVTMLLALEPSDMLIFRANETTTNTVADSNNVSHVSGGVSYALATYLADREDVVEALTTTAGITHDNGDAVVTVKDHLDTESGRIDTLETTTAGLSASAANAWTTDNLGLTGSVLAFAGSTAPTGFLLCTGSTISRTTYAALFAVIGTAYGAGDGVTTFRLPDLRAEFIRGLDAGRGLDTGRVLGTSQADAFEAHEHDTYGIYEQYDGGGSNTPAFGRSATYTGVLPTSEVGGTETRPRNVAMNYIIKT